MENKILGVLKADKVQIGNVSIPCAVLEDETRVLSETGISLAILGTRSGSSIRTKKTQNAIGAPIPVFIAANNLKPFIPEDLKVGALSLIQYKVGGRIVRGYDATILPIICDIWLKAREAGALRPQQFDRAQKAEILMRGLAHVGIIALIDEATGFQYDRTYDALRVLLETYLNEKIKAWTKQFPDRFFEELDRLYNNQKMKAQQRPKYYGTFINKYIYEPIEKGLISQELQRRYIADGKKHRKHQHLTDIGEGQLRLQIGRIMGLMEIAPSLEWFKNRQNRHGQLSFLDELE